MIINELFEKEVDGRKSRGLSELIYDESGRDADKFQIVKDTGLAYFGEYLERHEQRGMTVTDILWAVAQNQNKLEGYQIYDGQMEMFIERVDLLRIERNDFKLDMLYAMFLQKMGINKKFDTVFDEIIKYLKLDDNFLLFSAAIKEGYIVLTTNIKSSIVELLQEGHLTVDMDYIVSTVDSRSYASFETNTYLYVIKNICNIYDLRKKDFLKNPDRLNIFKALKLFGTKDTNYDICNRFLCLGKQEFYYLALKVANETYAVGAAMVAANTMLISKLEEHINPNSDLYVSFPKLSIRVKGGYDTDVISVTNIDFSEVTREYYPRAVFIYNRYKYEYTYGKMESLFTKSDFIEYVESNNENGSFNLKIYSTIAMSVIKYSPDKGIRDIYYELIKNQSDLSVNNIAVLYSKGYAPVDAIYEKIFSINGAGRLATKDVVQDVMNMCLSNNLNDLLLGIVKKVMDEDIFFSNYYWKSRVLGNVIPRLKKEYLDNEEISDGERVEVALLLNDFAFIHRSSSYFEFIIKNSSNELFKTAVGLTDEDIKSIGEYLLNKGYTKSRNMYDEIKNIVYDEEYLAIEACEIAIHNHIFSGRDYDPNIDDLDRALRAVKSKDNIKNYFIAEISKLDKTFTGDANFMKSVRGMFRLNLITEEEAFRLAKERLCLVDLLKVELVEVELVEAV